MADVRKHRLEAKNYSHDFGPQLAEGDSLTGTPDVTVIQGNTDVTDEFGTPAPSVDGDTVVFTMAAAGSEEQDAGTYTLLIECDTAGGEHLVGEVLDADGVTYRRPTLRVYEDGDLGAP